MSDDMKEILSGLVECAVSDALPELAHKAPEVQAKDGQEPTVEYLRQQAREADAKTKSRPAKTLASVDKKALDKEFWETM